MGLGVRSSFKGTLMRGFVGRDRYGFRGLRFRVQL